MNHLICFNAQWPLLFLFLNVFKSKRISNKNKEMHVIITLSVSYTWLDARAIIVILKSAAPPVQSHSNSMRASFERHPYIHEKNSNPELNLNIMLVYVKIELMYSEFSIIYQKFTAKLPLILRIYHDRSKSLKY